MSLLKRLMGRQEVDHERIAKLRELVRTAEMLEKWQDSESFAWLMKQAGMLKDAYITKRDAAAADGVLQLTSAIGRAIAQKDQAMQEYTELLAEQRLAHESPPEPDQDAPEPRRSPQIT